MKYVLLDIAQAAERVGISTKALYAALARGSVPRRYSKGNLVVRESELLAWREQKSRGGRPRGQKLSEEAKQRISVANKQRWAERKAKK